MVIADFDNNDPNNGAGNSSAFSSGLSFWAPGESVEVTAEELQSQQRTLQLVEKLIEYMLRDKVDVKHLIQAYQLILDNHITIKGTRRVPSDIGRQLIIRLYDIIEPYRSLLLQTNDHGLYPTREIYDLRCAMYDIIKMYDKFCSNIRDVIVPPIPQQAPQTPAPDALPSAKPTGLVPGNAAESVDTAVTAVQEKTKGRKKAEPHVNRDELGVYFNAVFKGLYGNPDFFSLLVTEIEKLTTPTDLARVANMIYNCNKYVVKRHTKFSDWMRKFFKIVGVRCPNDLHENKYTPNDTFKNRFYFLPYNDQAHDN